MPEEPTYPGVFVQEVSNAIRHITGVDTSITAFVGYTRQGVPDQAAKIHSFAQFEAIYGGLDRASPLSYAVYQFFITGGGQAVIVRVETRGKAGLLGLTPSTGMNALKDVDLFNLLCVPETFDLPDADATQVANAGLRLCEGRRAFYIVDAPRTRTLGDIVAWADGLAPSRNGAIYFPGVRIVDPQGTERMPVMAPSGSVAGVFARTDQQRGVWKAPAGSDATLSGVIDFAISIGDEQNQDLNSNRINVLRRFPERLPVVWGARTLMGADAQGSEYKYVPVRRMALFLEESLARGLAWVAFEPNDEALWAKIRNDVGAFLHQQFRHGAFQGASPKQAYFVKCDADTTTQSDLANGVVSIEVGFAPLKPAEFLILKIQQAAGPSRFLV